MSMCGSIRRSFTAAEAPTMWVFRGGVDWGDNEGGERESWGDDEGDELEIVSCTVNVLWGVSYFRLTVLILRCA